MNDLTVLQYNNSSIRTVMRDNELWWVLKDLGAVLGFTSGKRIKARLDADEWDEVTFSDPIGRKQSTTIINEPGLYSVILRSNKPEAKPFKRWVTHEVLPEIRKKGYYVSNSDPQNGAESELERHIAEISGRTKAISAPKTSEIPIDPKIAKWKEGIENDLKKISEEWRIPNRYLRARIYKELEQKVGCDLEVMVVALRQLRFENGLCASRLARITKLDAIAENKAYQEAFTEIIKSYLSR